jgi:cytochrome c5
LSNPANKFKLASKLVVTLKVMSSTDHKDEHDRFIKTPKQLIAVVTLALVVPILIIVMLAAWVDSGSRDGAGSQAMSKEAIENRIRPVADLALKGAGGAKALKTGAEVYTAQCAACHAAGIAGSPKFGDVGAWAARLKTGYDALYTSAIKGKGSMAAQGGGDYDDVEIARAVVHMANASGGKFAEPSATPAPAAATPAATAAPVPAPAVAAAPVAAAVAAVAVASTPATNASKGKALYDSSCGACHGAGVAGAPKFGDKTAWAPLAKEGVKHLVETVIKGQGAMPPKGGRPDATEADITAAVEFMLAAAK